MFMAMRAEPMLLDFWITSCTVSAACGWASRTTSGPTTRLPGAVLMVCSGLMRRVSSASATTSGFIVEPGSNTSVSARLRSRPSLGLPRFSGS